MKKKILTGKDKEKVALEFSEINEQEFEKYKKTLQDISFLLDVMTPEDFQSVALSLRQNPGILQNLPGIMEKMKTMGFA